MHSVFGSGVILSAPWEFGGVSWWDWAQRLTGHTRILPIFLALLPPPGSWLFLATDCFCPCVNLLELRRKLLGRQSHYDMLGLVRAWLAVYYTPGNMSRTSLLWPSPLDGPLPETLLLFPLHSDSLVSAQKRTHNSVIETAHITLERLQRLIGSLSE